MILDTNGVAKRATDIKTPGISTEFRPGSNGTSPGPQNPSFGVKNKYDFFVSPSERG